MKSLSEMGIVYIYQTRPGHLWLLESPVEGRKIDFNYFVLISNIDAGVDGKG